MTTDDENFVMIVLEDEITQQQQRGEYLELRPNRETWDKEFKDFRNFVEIQARKRMFDRYPAILANIYLILTSSFRWCLLELDKKRILTQN